jgi:sugar phosphate isomerase/epimerase
MNHLRNTSSAQWPALSRRRLIKSGVAAGGLWLALRDQLDAFAAVGSTSNSPRRYKIGVCDWMMLKRQKLGAFPLAKEVGADGVEVDMGSLGQRETFDNALSDPMVRKQFLEAARQNNLEISSIAMSAFYAQSFAERPTVPLMIGDCIETMKALGVKVAFLPLGVRGDLVKYPQLRTAIVERLKSVAPVAEKAGVILGLETALDATGEIKLLDEIGSPAVRIYYNFENPVQGKRDLYAELRILGKDRICQIHCTDQDGVLLQNNPRIDMAKVKRTLDEMNWSGWLVIERSRDAHDSRNVRKNFGANAKFMKSVFQTS